MTEVIEGTSLAQLMTEKRLVDSRRVARDVLAALRRAHSAGWVHGDIKPSNIIVRPDGSSVLVDWELADRVGRPVPPGSLGYAPAHAWEPGYRAETRNDTYSLAVLLAELSTGERLFQGERARVIAQQRAFAFGALDAADAVVRLVYDAADGGIGAEATRIQLSESLLRLRFEQVIRLSTRGAASSVVAALQQSDSAISQNIPFLDQKEQLSRAVAERWRASTRSNAVVLEDLVACIASGALTADEHHPGARRRRLCALAGALSERLADLPTGVVLGDLRDPEVSILASELSKSLAAVGVKGWRIAAIAAAPAEDVTRGGVRGSVRDALQVALATSHVSSAVCEAVVRNRADRLGPALRAIIELARLGAFGGCSGHVEIAGESKETQREWLHAIELELRASSERCAVVANDRGSPDDPLARAESLLVRGEVLAAYPVLVRATTEILSEPAGSALEGDVTRITDLWLEFGSTDAAEAVLSTIERAAASEAILRRHGRAAATNGDICALRSIAEDLRQAGCDAADLELARFEAIVLQSEGNLDAAHARLRGACSARPTAPDPVHLAEALAEWGLVARARGRLHSGARLLRQARVVADEGGAVRVALRIDANLLVLESTTATGSTNAQAWADLAGRCRKWGLQAAARRHSVRAATLYLEADDPVRAERSLADAETAARAGGRVPGIWRDMERYLDAQIRARRDLPLARVRRPENATGRPPRWRHWLAGELHDASVQPRLPIPDALLPKDARSDVVRLARVVIRWVARGGDASARLVRALGRVEGAFKSRAPSVGSLARYAVRSATSEWPLVGLLAVLRDSLVLDEAIRDLALAFHAATFVWSDYSDTTAAAWLRSHAPEIDEARPYGVFAWEWRLAMLRADTILGQEPDVDTRLEGVLDALEAWATNLPPHKREAYLGVVPFERIAATAGFAGPDHLKIPHGGEMLVAFRAHLRREAVRFRGSRGRAAGLERVLHSALRLRSGMSIDEVLREVVSGVLSVCRAERAVVVFDGPSGERRAKLATLDRMEDVRDSDAEVSQSAIDHARREGRACIFDDACGSAEFGDSPSVRLYRPRSLMIAPLQAHGETLGYVYVENRSLPKSFSASDLQLLEGFAAQAGLAIDNARLVEELRDSLEELKRVRTEAVRAESLRVLGQMAGEVAHDFNNLLAVILGETQLLLQDRPDAGMERSLEVIERAAMDGAAAIRRIQSSTRVRPREEFTVLDLGVLAREVLDFTRVRWTSASADPSRAIRTRCRSAQGVFVSGLGPELREVFTNLVLNAVDAMPEGGDLLVSVRAVEGVAEVEVRDSGCGIPENIRERVFDPFFSTKGEKGNGLGLAIAKEIVERHGGGICVTSTPGEGTSMLIHLPTVEAPAPEATSAPQPSRYAASKRVGASSRVLLVDDEVGVLRVLAAMLRAEGFEVIESSSGDEAIRRMQAGERYDLVITDLYMPGTSGVEVIETTRRTEAARRVVVMSGYGDVVGEGRLARRSVDGVLSKPFTLSDVREVVAHPVTGD